MNGRGDSFRLAIEKMRDAGCGEAAIKAFGRNFDLLASGRDGEIAEGEIFPVPELPRFEDVAGKTDASADFLGQTAVIKLNGGLGTSMGLERAKSLLPLRDGMTFLDFIAMQVTHLRKVSGKSLCFLLMNSFSTSQDTLEHLKKFSELGSGADLEFLQGKVPKLDTGTLGPVTWERDPGLEWCPPGHGDIYVSLSASGMLRKLRDAGILYLFVSNADNLGATLDPGLLEYFAKSGLDFMMEVCRRTPIDKKGGHLARNRSERLILREAAQCPEEDKEAFQDIDRHCFFNTNNLWIRLDRLEEALEENGGILPLPLIRNAKTVDPKDKTSPKVWQLETAMGAAIECFDHSGAVLVPRTRFAPVKTTDDLLIVRSDAFQVTEDYRLVLDPVRDGEPPRVSLDPEHYKIMSSFETLFSGNVPSLKKCRSLKVEGSVRFDDGCVIQGDVVVQNLDPSGCEKTLASGSYTDQTVELR